MKIKLKFRTNLFQQKFQIKKIFFNIYKLQLETKQKFRNFKLKNASNLIMLSYRQKIEKISCLHTTRTKPKITDSLRCIAGWNFTSVSNPSSKNKKKLSDFLIVISLKINQPSGTKCRTSILLDTDNRKLYFLWFFSLERKNTKIIDNSKELKSSLIYLFPFCSTGVRTTNHDS